MVEHYSSDGDIIQISTAPDKEGIVRRIAVKARDAGSRPDWIVFALTNDSDEQIDRLLVAPHFRLSGSGVIWPDLGSLRVAAITASQGIRPEREDNTEADAFVITLDPGTTVTFVAELGSPNLPQMYLWDPAAYKDWQNGHTLYKGIIIGIAGLLALFLTVVVVVKGSLVFPAVAALAWAVLGYACIDFGFLQRIFTISQSAEQVYRASAEAILAATLLVVLFAYLNLGRWHVRYKHMAWAWLLFLIALVAIASFDPAIAAGVARISIAVIVAVGFILVVNLATHGYDRAIMLIPTWLLLVAWTAAASFAVIGELSTDVVPSALIGGLVLIVMLLGFTVMQQAFSGGGFSLQPASDAERRALALAGSGDIVFDWNVISDKISISPELEQMLGLKKGTLAGNPASAWLECIHPFDRDRYRISLDAITEQRRGQLHQDFRLRSSADSYYWFRLKARPVVGGNGEVLRVIGTLIDVTETKMAEERLLHDAIHDNLTRLPNKQLFSDRLGTFLRIATADESWRPTVLTIDLDHFKKINELIGISAGDSVLLTISRRLSRLMRPQDTIARLGSDEFAIILLSEREPDRVVAFADMVRRAITTPITYADKEISLSASLGLVLYDPSTSVQANEVIKSAEIAVAHAKSQGGNRIEVFRPSMRNDLSDVIAMEHDLKRALAQNEIKLLFQPIVKLEDRTVAGFETILYWEHPHLGKLEPKDFIPLAEESGHIIEIGQLLLEQTAHELAAWQQALDVDPPIFATVKMPSRYLLRHELLQDVKSVITRAGILPGSLKLEFAESVVMENPEFATQLFQRLRDLGAGLSLDDFGTGYSAMSYLQRLPFDTIKIDESFVRQLSNGPSPVILSSIINLAAALGMEAVAEGTETESNAIVLYQLGCAYATGSAFGDPMTAQQARRLMGA
ncbi:EAL domain-containing protein [Microvirga sp. W0021]|uniref:EAL domain-containing protein n=2 Tax=Hohaiivirga grylli TaxID=3133970 RepID=A0ABV0BH72_9HYPH